MNDARRIAAIACFMLVTLRLMIGWQLFYEGLWKINTLKTPTPWTAAGYLRNAQGPLRDTFRSMAGDPDDLNWIEAKPLGKSKDRFQVPAVEKQWKDWEKKFTNHYGLKKNQKAALKRLVHGSEKYYADLEALPPSVDFKAAKLDGYISYDAKNKRLVVDGVKHLIPAHRAKLEKLVDADLDGIPNEADFDFTSAPEESNAKDEDNDGIDDLADASMTEGKDENKNGIDDSHPTDLEAIYLKALNVVFLRSKRGMGYIEKLRATVAGNPDWVEDKSSQRLGEIQKYKGMLADYEADLKKANQAFEWDHLKYTWGKIQEKRSELVGPVKALDKEMKDKAMEMLSTKQMGRGAVGEPFTALRISDLLTIAGLTILGACLMLGLLTRFSALMAAVMLFMFYAAIPPWPGVPEQPGPEHAFIVNKNFIEVIALLAIACLPTGRWFGVDGMIGRWLGKRKAAKQQATT